MDIIFNGGDEVRQPFRIMVGEDVADLTGCTVSAHVVTRNIVLTAGQGLTIENMVPTGDDPHGFFVLTEEMTALLPMGRIARIRLVVVNQDDVTVSTTDTFLNRVG